MKEQKHKAQIKNKLNGRFKFPQSDHVIHDLKADLTQKQQPTTKLAVYKTSLST